MKSGSKMKKIEIKEMEGKGREERNEGSVYRGQYSGEGRRWDCVAAKRWPTKRRKGRRG